MPSDHVQVTAPEVFIVIRRNSERPGPRSYPVIKHADGTIEKITWGDFHASRNVSNN